MPTAAVVTLIGTALLVGALAAYLTVITFILKHVNFTLGTIIVGIKAIAHQVEPVNPIVGEINRELTSVKDALENLLESKSGSGAPKRATRRRA